MNRSQTILSCLFLALGLLATTGCEEITARRAVQKGNELYKNGRYEEAIERFEFALGKAPDLEIAHHNAALSYHKLFQPGVETPENLGYAKKAVEHFQAYLATSPNDQKIVKVMVKTYVDSGDYPGAVAHWEKVLASKPNDPEALTQLAIINEQAKDFDAALRWHRKRVEVAADKTDKFNALFAIGSLQQRRLRADGDLLGEDRLRIADEGIAAIQAAAALDPHSEMVQSMIDALYQQRAFAYEVSWARTIEGTAAFKHRLKWNELYQKKLKAAEQPQQTGSNEG